MISVQFCCGYLGFILFESLCNIPSDLGWKPGTNYKAASACISGGGLNTGLASQLLETPSDDVICTVHLGGLAVSTMICADKAKNAGIHGKSYSLKYKLDAAVDCDVQIYAGSCGIEAGSHIHARG